MSFSKHSSYLLLLLCVVALVRASLEFLPLLSITMQGAVDRDVHQYFIVARGLLTGLNPYIDLYESKPPGIFFLAALSLFSTGGPQLYILLSVCTLIVLPILFGWHGGRLARDMSAPTRFVYIASASAMGMLLSVYLGVRASGAEVQSFGAFFGVLYIFTLFRAPFHFSWGALIVRAVLLLLSIGIMEPFFPVLLAAALLCAKDGRQFVITFVYPLIAGIILGVLLLSLIGMIGPYATVYLPAMLFTDKMQEPLYPLPLRFFGFVTLFKNLTSQFTPMPLLGWWIAGMFTISTAWKAYGGSHWRALLEGGGVTVVCLVLVHFMNKLFQILNTLRLPRYTYDPHELRTTLMFTVIFATLAFGFWRYRRRYFQISQLLKAFVAVGLVSFTVGLSGFANNHFAFAVPFYAVLALLSLSMASSEDTNAAVRNILLAVPAVLLLFLRFPAQDVEALKGRLEPSRAVQNQVVSRLDTLMDACNMERFYAIEADDYLSFSSHAMWGPLPVLRLHPYLADTDPLVTGTLHNIAQETPIIITPAQYMTYGQNDSGFDAYIKNVLLTEFTRNPPPCAEEHLPIGDAFIVWFRQ